MCIHQAKKCDAFKKKRCSRLSSGSCDNAKMQREGTKILRFEQHLLNFRDLHLHPLMGADERAFDSKCKAVVLAGSVLPLHLIDTWGNSLLKKSMREMLRKNVGQGKPCSECAQRSSGSNQSLASETSFLYNVMW
jgi:hypothetical protein